MDLAQLRFQVDTRELDRAGAAIGELVVNVGKLDKAARDQARVEATLAKAAKDSAKANLDNAKAVESTEKAQKSAANAVARSTSILERQKDILEFQTQGFSKGQSSILAYGKAAGLAAADISELGKVLETQRKLMGSDPFDKSLSGIKSLQNQYTELKESVRQYATDSNLSAKQTRELARDKERLIEKMKVEGASFSDIRKAVRAHNDEYVALASSYNKMTSAEDAVIKSRKDAVNATNYLTQADQKMSAALNITNTSLDRAGTDSLVKYETALRKSGLAQDVVSTKLAAYKSQLVQVQAQESKRAEQHLTRAISPQLMDIGVSLYSGQNPMTVLIQQAGQLTDLFQLSGVEATKLGDAMRKSFYSMVPAIASVAKGLAGLVFGMFYDAGKGITNFIGNVTGMNAVLGHTDDLLYLIGGRATWFSKILHGLGAVASATFGAGIFAIVAGLGALAVGMKQVITENNDLAKAFALSGASVGLSHTQVLGYVKALADSGATTGQATEALLAMAKAGNFTSGEILLVSESAIRMQKGFGIAIEDTVKQFAKLKEKPVEALLEIAKSSGMVGPEIIKMVQELEQAGRTTEAAALAMKSYASVTEQEVSKMKENYNGFSLFIIKLGGIIKQFFSDTFKTLFLATDPNQQLEEQLKGVRGEIKRVSDNLKDVGSFGDTKLLKSLEEQERILISQIGASVRLNGEEEKRKAINAENARYEEAILKLRKGSEDFIDKELRKTQSLADFRKSFIEDKLKEVSREKAVDIERLKANTDLMTILQKQADIEYGKAHKSDKKQAIKDLETEIDLRNKGLGLLSSFNNELDQIQRRFKATGDVDQYRDSLLDLIKLQPFYIKQQKDINAAHDLTNKLVGKQDLLGAEYLNTLEEIDKYQKMGVENGGYSVEHADKLRKAAFEKTELAKQEQKYQEDSYNLQVQYLAEIQKSSDASSLENKKLDDRLALLGLTSDEQEKLKSQQQTQNALLGVNLRLAAQIAKIWVDVDKGKLDRDTARNVIIGFEREAQKERENINKEVVVKYREDFEREFLIPIKSGITDSIVTAMFDGGEAGSKKVRELLVNALRQRVTIYVDAVVNTIVGSAVSGLLGGASAANAAGTAGGMLSFGSSLATMGASLGEGFMATLGGSSIGGAGAAATLAGGSNLMGMVGGASAYLLGALAISRLLSGPGFTSSTNTGVTRSTFGAGGNLLGTTTGLGSAEQMKAMHDSTKALADTYFKTASSLGIKTIQSIFEVGSNTGREGAAPQTVLGVNIGGRSYSSGEISSGDTAGMQLAASRALLTALQASDLPKYLSGVFDGITASTATQDQITATLNNATALKNFYDQLQGMPWESLKDLSYAASQGLITAAGGLEKLSNSLATYYDKFYTDSEKSVLQTENLRKSFAALGYTLPALDGNTRSWYRSLVDSLMAQDQTNESNANATASVLALAGALDALVPSLSQATDDLSKQLSDAYSTLEKAVNTQLKILSEQEQAQTAVVQRLQSVFDVLKKNILDLYMQVDSTAGMLASQGRSVISQAMFSGVMPDAGVLGEAISAVRSGIENTNFVTQFESDKARLQLAADLRTLQGMTEGQLSVEEETLRAIKAQVKYYEDILVQAKAQIDATLGVQDAVLSVADALANLTRLMFPEDNKKPSGGSGTGSGTSFGGGSSPSGDSAAKYKRPVVLGSSTPYYMDITDTGEIAKLDKLSSIYQSFIGTGDVTGLFSAMSASGASLNDLSALSGFLPSDIQKAASSVGISLPAYKNGGYYSGGAALVGEDGAEIINFNRPGQIYNAAQTSQLLQGSASDSALAERVDQISVELQTIAINTGKVTRLLERVTRDGESLLITDTATL